MSNRGEYRDGLSQDALTTLLHFNRLRVYAVPAYVVSASSALILRDKFTSQNLFLNGMAIGFAMSSDDLLTFIFLGRKSKRLVE